MRYAVLADVHANLPALEAVIADLGRQGPDGVVVLGDIVGYGAFPNECVGAIAAAGWPCVAGNHDLMALGDLSEERCIPMARQTLAWTREVMSDDVRAYLASLPPRLTLPGGVVAAHGTLESPEEYLTTPDQAIANLTRLPTIAERSDILLVGHTHRIWACTVQGRALAVGGGGAVALGGLAVVVNPGAVGQVRGGRVCARYAIVDVERRTAEFRSVAYDVRRERRALARHGLPRGTYRIRRSVVGRLRRLARAQSRGRTAPDHERT